MPTCQLGVSAGCDLQLAGVASIIFLYGGRKLSQLEIANCLRILYLISSVLRWVSRSTRIAVRVSMFLGCSSNLYNRHLCSLMIGSKSSTYGSCPLHLYVFEPQEGISTASRGLYMVWISHAGYPRLQTMSSGTTAISQFYFTMHKPYTGRIETFSSSYKASADGRPPTAKSRGLSQQGNSTLDILV
ncbi:hypothetical protein K440DRAFT_183248 [Wilcoxina mikolae CBS 423.85]|nr:hypothetical protein K440DRAFT_183248 [Wilcoxina mikolae CBS 423.85]